GVLRRAKRDRLAIDDELTVVRAGRVDARQRLDQRRLAGSVLAAQRVHFAGAQIERHVAQSGDRAEALRDLVGLEDRRHGVGRPRKISSLLWKPSLITVISRFDLSTATVSERIAGTSIL